MLNSKSGILGVTTVLHDGSQTTSLSKFADGNGFLIAIENVIELSKINQLHELWTQVTVLWLYKNGKIYTKKIKTNTQTFWYS